MTGRNQKLSSMWKNSMKLVDLREPTFLTTCVSDAVDVNASRTKLSFEVHRKMFESRISARATEKLLGWGKKCVERYCELANKKTRAVVQSLNSLLGRP